MTLMEIFDLLHNAYGEQNWWPIVENNKCFYKKEYMERDRTEEEIFEIMIGAILTQNTSWKNVVKAIINLKENNIFSIEKILEVEIDFLANLIKPAGYYNQKAKKLKNISEFLLKNNILTLKQLPLKILREKFLAIWGIGYETADSILLYGFNHPIFVVDAYTRRIFYRLGFFSFDLPYEDIRNFFEENLKSSPYIYKEYHALIVEFGKNLCKKKPLCNLCYINDKCPSFAQKCT